MKRKIKFHRNYFLEFYQKLDVKEQAKFEQVFYIIKNADHISSKFFKSIKGSKGLYEIRIQYMRNSYRLFCFFDRGSLIIILHGILKKSWKINRKEIQRAERLRMEYFQEKGIET